MARSIRASRGARGEMASGFEHCTGAVVLGRSSL